MIKAKDGAVSVEGTPIELLVDLERIVCAVKENLMEEKEEEFAKKQINYAVKVGLMNNGEFKKEVKKKTLALVDELLGGLFDEDK